MYHSSCFLNMRLPNSRQYKVQPEMSPVNDPLRKLEVLIVLKYNLTELSVFSDTVQIWVISLLVLSLMLCCVVAVALAIFCKFKKSLTLRVDNAVYDLERSDHTHVTFKDNVEVPECDMCTAGELVDPGPAIAGIKVALQDIDVEASSGPGCSGITQTLPTPSCPPLPSTLPPSPSTSVFSRSQNLGNSSHIYATVRPGRKPRLSPSVFDGMLGAKPAKH